MFRSSTSTPRSSGCECKWTDGLIPLHGQMPPKTQLVEVDSTCTSAQWRAQATFRRRDQAGEAAGADSRPPGGRGGPRRGAARALQRGAEALASRMNTGRSRIPQDFRFAKVLYRWGRKCRPRRVIQVIRMGGEDHNGDHGKGDGR